MLLGGDAGSRVSEVIGLEQTDADYQRGYLNVLRRWLEQAERRTELEVHASE